MALRYYRNGPARSLAFPIALSSDTSMTVDSASGFPTQFPYTLIIEPDTALEEVVDVTAAVGNVLTITRGVDSTTASAHASGSTVYHGISARDPREANAHVNATTGVHGATGSLVDTDSAQTVTGAKNFTGGLTTTAGDVVAVGGTQAISGTKTFTDARTATGGAVVDVGSVQAVTGQKVFTDAQTAAGGSVVAVGGAQTITGTKTLSTAGDVRSATNGVDGSPRTKLSGDGLGRLQEVIVGHFVRKSTSEAIVGTTAPQNDDELSFPVVANAKYEVRLCLFWQANNLNDAQVGWSLPSGTFNMLKSAPSTNLPAGTTSGNGDWAAVRGAAAATLNLGITDGSTDIGTELTCLIEVAATGGTATVRWAQVTSGSTLTLMTGSWLHAVRVA